MSQYNKDLVGEFTLKRGKYSLEGEYASDGYLLSIDTEDVAYVRDDHGEKIGWIPATEKMWDSPKLDPFKRSKKLVKLWGYINSSDNIEVFLEPIQAVPKDITIDGGYHTQLSRPTINYLIKKETMLQNLIETNKQAAQQAAYLEAGRLANVALAGILAKKFPGLPQTPFNSLVLANIADQVAKNLKPNPQLAKVTSAMTTQAFLELYSMVDLEGMIHELLSDDSVKMYLGSTE